MEGEILNLVDKIYNIDGSKVSDSVKNGRLDKYNAIYYLALKNEKCTRRFTTN